MRDLYSIWDIDSCATTRPFRDIWRIQKPTVAPPPYTISKQAERDSPAIEKLVVEVDLPGVDKSTVKVKAKDQLLISYKSRRGTDVTFTIDYKTYCEEYEVDQSKVDSITAKMADGVLTIVIAFVQEVASFREITVE